MRSRCLYHKMNRMNNHPTTITKGDIIVVDDTPNNLRLLSTMLSDRGYKVRCVISGQMSLTACQIAPPDIILLDINMPEMNGYQVCERLKADEKTNEIPVIFISASNDVSDKAQAFSVGGADYISKPFQVEEVLARIENQLTIRSLKKQLVEQKALLQQEIRDRANAEAALQEKEEFIQLILERIPEQVLAEYHLSVSR